MIKNKEKKIFFNYSDSGDNIESQHCEARNPSRNKIGKDVRLVFLSLIFLSLNFLAYFGAYMYLNNLTSATQTVTVSSEGRAAEIYPDYMGQYNVLRDVYRYDRVVYKHVDREDRFIIYAGKSI